MTPQDFFSDISWDDRFSWFECSLPIERHSAITFYLKSSNSEDRVVLQRSIEIFVALGEQIDVICGRVSDQLLPVYNESWASGVEITKGEFVRWLSLAFFTMDLDGRVDLTFTCGDLFGDHEIRVDLDTELAVRSISLQ